MAATGSSGGSATLVFADVAQREPEPLTLDAHDDEAEAGPGVEPAVQQTQLGCAGRELEEAEGGAEEGEPVIGHGSRISAEPAGVIGSPRGGGPARHGDTGASSCRRDTGRNPSRESARWLLPAGWPHRSSHNVQRHRRHGGVS
jgi:hypothetical protein